MRLLKAPVRLAALLLLVLTTALLGPGQAQAGGDRVSSWAAVDTASIHPGVQMFTDGAQCTGNFVFTDNQGHVYLGYAAHCAGKGEATDTNGCLTPSLPLGTRVRFAQGADLATGGETVGRGRLVYSSWEAMQRVGERASGPCEANDFALVRLASQHVAKVNPSVPFWGGPTGLSTRGAPTGSEVYSWGQSSLRPGSALSPRTGASLGRTNGGWGWDVYTATPGVPGDSGSGFLDAQGRAFGTLSTIALAPLAGSNGLGDLEHELRYAQQHAGIPGLRLVPGTEEFSPVR